MHAFATKYHLSNKRCSNLFSLNYRTLSLFTIFLFERWGERNKRQGRSFDKSQFFYLTVFGIHVYRKTINLSIMNLMKVKMRAFMQTFPWSGMSLLWGLDFVVGVEGISEGHCLRQGTFPGKCLLSVLGLRQFPEKLKTLLKFQ